MTLEQFVDELIKRAAAKGYTPSTFIRMRGQYGTVAAIRRLVETSEPQSGFLRLQKIGLENWCLESAVTKFPELFTSKTVAYAQARLAGTFDDREK